MFRLAGLRASAAAAEAALAPGDRGVRIGAFRQQQPGHVEVRQLAARPRDRLGIFAVHREIRRCAGLVQPDDHVQRMAARVGHVGIGAGVQQQRGQIEIGVQDRHAERRRAVGYPVVDVGALRQQELDSLVPVVAHGEEQRRVAALGALVQLRAEFEQQPRRRPCCLRPRRTSAPSARGRIRPGRPARRAAAARARQRRCRCAPRS